MQALQTNSQDAVLETLCRAQGGSKGGDMKTLQATIVAHYHPQHRDEEVFTWHVLLGHPGGPFIASLDAMSRYRYRSRQKAHDAARRMVAKLFPAAEIRR